MNPTLPYRPNVCLLIHNTSYELFVGERKGSPGTWQLPQGGVDSEAIETSALREAHEETGIPLDLLKPVMQLKAVHKYDFDQVPLYAKDKWRGQRQNFFVIKFLGKDKDIKLDLYDAEFTNYQWCNYENIQDIVEEKRRPGYQEALNEYHNYLITHAIPT